MPTPQEKRRPRFVRVAIRPIQLTDRDVEIVGHVAAHRLIDSHHLIALLPHHSPQHTLRRLQLLFQHGYLDRPPIQRVKRLQLAGSFPIVYALGRKGAALLTREQGIAPPERWTTKNKELVSEPFFDHTLLLSEIAVAFSAGCREHGNARVVPFAEILARAPEATRGKPRAHRWRVDIPSRPPLSVAGSVGIAPDAIFGIEFTGATTGTAYFFLEADRATMPIVRGRIAPGAKVSLAGTSLLKKFLAYHETHRSALHTKQFGFKNFRVLTVTTGSEQRVAAMAQAAAQLPPPHGTFLFASLASLRAGNPLLMPWKNPKGETVQLAV